MWTSSYNDLRAVAVVACAAGVAVCGPGPPPPGAAGPPAMQVTYYHAGRARPVPPAVLPPAVVDSVLREMLEGTDDMVRMYVNDERMQLYREHETGLEIVFPAESTLHAGALGDVRADRVFLLISVPDGHSVAVFHGAGAYLMPPLINPRGKAILQRLEPRLQALAPAP